MATEMAEVYWLALTRDVPFREYETDALVAAAVVDMNAFAEPLSGIGQKLTPTTVFRGETPGDLIGPYLSQFLWLEIPYGIKTVEQRYTVPRPPRPSLKRGKRIDGARQLPAPEEACREGRNGQTRASLLIGAKRPEIRLPRENIKSILAGAHSEFLRDRLKKNSCFMSPR